MARAKRVPAGNRGSESRGRQAARGSEGKPWSLKEPEDDPLRDLRPVDEEPPLDSEGDEYIWPELQDEYEDD